jgi:signal transduction histidine kinase
MLPANYQPYIQGIREEADALGRVVTNFLNFARPDRIAFSPVHLGPLVSGAIDDLRHDNPLAQIEARGEFGVVDGDEVLLRQMIANLIRNGLEASRADGKAPIVAIEGRTDPAERVCRFTVEDNGPGISPALRDRVFRPFFTTKAQGTGLGLAIVQKVVVTHNGKVTVGSSVLGGARFEVTFPMAAA